MRGKQTPVRPIKPDEVYNSELVTKFINYIMMSGKKSIARTIVYNAIEDLQTKTKTKGIEAFEKAIENVKPRVEVRSKRVGGSNFQVPVQVNANRQLSLAARWIIDAARAARKNTEFWVVLSQELLNAYNKEGTAIKKKDEVHRMAEANKAFAQFA
jgi:small subunit ribosomal protein S7